MRDLAYRQMAKVASLPTPSALLEGVVVELSTDKKPYYCNGVTWVDLTSGGGGGGTQQVFAQPTAPVVTPGTPYLWFQTGLNGGQDMTLWVEDGVI